jgi:hypothetical protein
MFMIISYGYWEVSLKMGYCLLSLPNKQ